MNVCDGRIPDRVRAKIVVDGRGCWVWQGCLHAGYGRVRAGNRTRILHRFVYESLVGQVPPGLDLDHLCRVRACCNPSHLEPVTRGENTRRGHTGKHNADKTHCRNGHPYDQANTYWAPNNAGRHCRICKHAGIRAARARAKAEAVKK